MQDRIIELETKFSFQEETLLELNEVIIRQQRQLDNMELKMNRLTEQLEELMAQRPDGGTSAPVDEKPPHY